MGYQLPLRGAGLPGPVVDAAALAEVLRRRRRRREKIGGSGGEYGGVEVGIVDLITAPAAEKLGSVHVDGDVVAVALGGRVRGGVDVAVHGGARHASVETVARGARPRRAPQRLTPAFPAAYEGPAHRPGPHAVL